MKAIRQACVVLAALFLAGALVSYVVGFHQIETTTAVLGGAATALAFLAYGLLVRERSSR